MTDDPKFRPTDEDKFGVGMNADGRVNVMTPEAYAKAVEERNAEEELDGDDPVEQEDFADLMEQAE